MNKIKQIQEILRDPFPQSLYPQLSQLERNIAKLIVVEGLTAQETADALGSKKNTVNSYLIRIYKAIGVKRNKWPKLVFDRIREVLKE